MKTVLMQENQKGASDACLQVLQILKLFGFTFVMYAWAWAVCTHTYRLPKSGGHKFSRVLMQQQRHGFLKKCAL
jgi:hypothetical protein